MFIMAIGVAALVRDWHWRRRCRYEGKLSVTAAVVYVTGETLEAAITKGRVASFYVKHGLHAWMAAVIGVCGLVLLECPNVEAGAKLKAMPHIWFAGAWSFFIYNHKQPNDFGIMMHWAATAWILIGGGLRVMTTSTKDIDSVRDSGCAYIMAAYTFFGGQLGLTLTAETNKANVGSYVLIWHVIPITVIFAYIRLFLRGTPHDDLAFGDIEMERSRLLPSSSGGPATGGGASPSEMKHG